MNCYEHTDSTAVATCACGRGLCGACQGRHQPPTCEPCHSAAQTARIEKMLKIKDDWTERLFGSSKDLAPGERAIPFHLAPAIIVSVGALMVLASMFMPAFSSDQLFSISGNMMIQSDPALLLCAVAALIATIRYWNTGSLSSANTAIYAGFWFFCWTVRDAYSGQLQNGFGTPVQTSADAGFWATGIGCLLVAYGGLMMRFPHLSFGLVPGPVAPLGEHSTVATTKTCPKCAEKIKAAAAVCRYCHYEFEPASHI